MLNEKDMLDRILQAAQVYNDGRLHRDFQAKEIYNFIEWMYKQYGYVYPTTTKTPLPPQ